jgi:hypothetical protein
MPELFARAICDNDQLSKDDFDRQEEMKKEIDRVREALSQPNPNPKPKPNPIRNFKSIPIDQDQSAQIDCILGAYESLVEIINGELSENRHKSLCLTELETSCMYAVKAITHK